MSTVQHTTTENNCRSNKKELCTWRAAEVRQNLFTFEFGAKSEITEFQIDTLASSWVEGQEDVLRFQIYNKPFDRE